MPTVPAKFISATGDVVRTIDLEVDHLPPASHFFLEGGRMFNLRRDSDEIIYDQVLPSTGVA